MVWGHCGGKIYWVMKLEIEKWDEGFKSFLLRTLRCIELDRFSLTWGAIWHETKNIYTQPCYERLHNVDVILEGITWVKSGPQNLHTRKKKKKNIETPPKTTSTHVNGSNNPITPTGNLSKWGEFLLAGPSPGIFMTQRRQSKGRSEGENNLRPLRHGSRGHQGLEGPWANVALCHTHTHRITEKCFTAPHWWDTHSQALSHDSRCNSLPTSSEQKLWEEWSSSLWCIITQLLQGGEWK